jgi:DNA processing protein
MSTASLKYKIALSFIPKIGDITAKKLVSYVGSVEALFNEKRKNLIKIPGVGEVIAKSITNNEALAKADKELNFVEKHNISVHYYLDDNYPIRLKQCQDAPVVFYSKGHFEINPPKMLSIVGTRHPTEEGLDNCKLIVDQLGETNKDVCIVSGLAYGIDACAHKSALNNNLQTYAVLGHGLDSLYPALHKKMAAEITEQGALVTDFPSGSAMDGNNFVKRNRIIAGLSDATLVIQSATNGGAMITADIASSYDRDVLAVPGRPSDKYAKGCNRLIKSNKAALVEDAADVEYVMDWLKKERKKDQVVQARLFEELESEEKEVLNMLKEKGEQPIDQLCFMLEKPTSKVSPLLLNLEFKGLVNCMPGKVYKARNI